MIKTIIINRWVGETLDENSWVISLTEPWLSGLALMEMEGVGASKSNINVDESPSFDGAFFNSTHINSRNISLKFQYYYDPLMQTEDRSVIVENQRAFKNLEQIRQLTYRYFRSKSKIRLTVITDNRNSYIDGYVESNEPNIFDEKSGCSISIICPDPFFYYSENAFMGLGHSEARGAFSFPFPARGILKPDYCDDFMFSFGMPGETTRRVKINYSGDIEIGAIFRITILSDDTIGKNITIYNADYGESMQIISGGITRETGRVLQKGDVIEVSSIKGNKYCRLMYMENTDGETTSVTKNLGFQSFPKSNDWLSIVGGENTFSYSYEDGDGKPYPNELKISIETRIKYEGI